MQTQTFNSQSQRCGTAFSQRQSIAEALADARQNHQEWWVLFDEFSHLHVPGSADVDVCAELVNTAPDDFLAGYVAGLFENN